MNQQVVRDTLKIINFRGMKEMPPDTFVSEKRDTIGMFKSDDGQWNYVVSVGENMFALPTKKFFDFELYDKPDFSFIQSMKNIESIQPCSESFVTPVKSQSASDIIGSIKVQSNRIEPLFTSDPIFSEVVIYLMAAFSLKMIFTLIIKTSECITQVGRVWRS